MTTTAQPAVQEIVVPANMLPLQVTGMQAMASKMWIPLIAMGFMIVVAALVIGVIVSVTAADWFSFSKLTREAAATGSDLAKEKAFIESTKAWLPPFKFPGAGCSPTFWRTSGFGATPWPRSCPRLRSAKPAVRLPQAQQASTSYTEEGGNWK